MTPYFKQKSKYLVIMLLLSIIYFACQSEKQEAVGIGLVEEKVVNEDSLAQLGQDIVQQSFATLSGALSQQIKDSGAVKAITYCNLNAYPLIDSLSSLYNVSIKRTSYSIRNPLNEATQLEKDVLFNYHADDTQGKPIKGFLQKDVEGKYHYFAPIYVMETCAKCHGTANQTLDSVAYTKILELYPNDKATGYKAGDLRGMWSISF